MRLRSIVSLAGVAVMLATAFPASAASKTMEYGLAQYWCRRMHKEGEFTRSLALCQGAADQAKADRLASNNWLSYDGEAQALEIIALDDSALGHHHAAYKAANEAHRLSYYLVTYFTLDPDDKVTINSRISRLVPIESRELGYIRQGIGD